MSQLDAAAAASSRYRLRGLRLRQPHRGVADVPVLLRGRHAHRLAPGAPRQPRGRRRGARVRGGDPRLARTAASRPAARGCTSRSTSPRGGGSWTSCTDRRRARIGLQLAHAGRKGSCSRPWEGDAPLGEGGWELVAPSAIPFAEGWPVPRAMDPRGHGPRARGVRARGAHGRRGRLRRDRAAHGPRLPARDLHLSAHERAPGRVRRADREPPALSRSRCSSAVRAAWPAEKPVSVRISANGLEGGRPLRRGPRRPRPDLQGARAATRSTSPAG